MIRMREEKVFKFQHPIFNINKHILALLNIVSWNKHISHHFIDPIYLSMCSMLCFTETKVVNLDNIDRINNFDPD